MLEQQMVQNRPRFREFFNWSKNYIEKHGGILDIRDVRYLRDGGKHGGECDGNRIVVAGRNPLFREVYVHEFSHFQQAKQNSPYWDYSGDIYRKIENQTITQSDWSEIYSIILLERDCEKRTLKHSLNWGLFNNELYAQRANVYLCFYQYVFLKRKWVNTTVLYKKDLVSVMPSKLFSIKSLKKIDMDIMAIFDKHFA